MTPESKRKGDLDIYFFGGHNLRLPSVFSCFIIFLIVIFGESGPSLVESWRKSRKCTELMLFPFPCKICIRNANDSNDYLSTCK